MGSSPQRSYRCQACLVGAWVSPRGSARRAGLISRHPKKSISSQDFWEVTSDRRSSPVFCSWTHHVSYWAPFGFTPDEIASSKSLLRIDGNWLDRQTSFIVPSSDSA